jgi:hypothetical protein
MVIAVQIAAVVCGLISAILWWRSSLIKFKPSPGLPDGSGGDGNLGVVLSNGDTLFWDIDKQGRLNAWAAAATAVSTMLQALAVALQVYGK